MSLDLVSLKSQSPNINTAVLFGSPAHVVYSRGPCLLKMFVGFLGPVVELACFISFSDSFLVVHFDVLNK